MTNKANIYSKAGNNPTLEFSDSSRANLGLCFSGGGSRALTCAWGQLLGLETLKLASKARYISSVSGGTWASSIYTYMPDSISDDDLLGRYYPPAKLSLNDASGAMNVNQLGQYSLGKAPASMGLPDLMAWTGYFIYWYQESGYKWLWASIVSNFVLQHYQLNDKGHEPWVSGNSFSLSSSYANDYFPADAPDTENFFYVHAGRPFLIINDNIMKTVQTEIKNNIVQLPNQATPVSAGAQGQVPDGSIVGGGSVESYGYNSTLEQNEAVESPVTVTIAQPYSLIDCVSTSSAFFAETLASYFNQHISDAGSRSELAREIKKLIPKQKRKTLLERLDGDIEDDIEKALLDFLQSNHFNPADFIPEYNYWTLGSHSTNQTMQYTDGGTLDNTGILGMLAQTDNGKENQPPIWLIAFDNTDTPLQHRHRYKIAGSQAAPLFGIQFNTTTGEFSPFTIQQKDPANNAFVSTSLIEIFDNSPDESGSPPFCKLVCGLYATNCGAKPGQPVDDSKINTAPAYYQTTLTTVENPLANITAGRTVHLLYIQNAKVLNWQNQIADEELRQAIAAGQESSADIFSEFKDFPYYNTFYKIGLSAKESNTLSQMWAWQVADDDSPLSSVIKDFIEGAA
ncbi:MAG: hypothetical protein P8X74_08715 [Reinekea sp.]|jgi:hypothetical protein